MILRLSPRIRARQILTLTLAAGGLALYACDRTPTAPNHSASQPQFAAGGTANVTITVYKSGGAEVQPNALVSFYTTGEDPVHVTTGPDGTNSVSLPGGDYCVVARVVEPDALSPNALDNAVVLVAPPPGHNNDIDGTATDQAPVVLDKKGDSVPASAGTVKNCFTQLPFKAHGNASLTMTLAQLPVQVTPSYKDYNGQPLSDIISWAVIPLDPSTPNLNLPPGLDPAIHSALLSSTANSNAAANGHAVPSGVPFYIEVLQQLDSSTPAAATTNPGGLAAMMAGDPQWVVQTIHSNGETSDVTLDAPLSPLYCDKNTYDDSGDAGSQGVDIQTVRYGYQSSGELDPDLSKIALQITTLGAADFTVPIRFRTANSGTKSLFVDYTCTADSCTVDDINGTALGLGVNAAVFFYQLGDAQFRATILLTGVPVDVQDVQVNVKTAGDAAPNSSKTPTDTVTDAFFSVLRPRLDSSGKCILDNVNDGRWITY